MIDWKIIVTGLICITILESIALIKGVNGQLLTVVIGSICAVIGWKIPHQQKEEVKIKL